MPQHHRATDHGLVVVPEHGHGARCPSSRLPSRAGCPKPCSRARPLLAARCSPSPDRPPKPPRSDRAPHDRRDRAGVVAAPHGWCRAVFCRQPEPHSTHQGATSPAYVTSVAELRPSPSASVTQGPAAGSSSTSALSANPRFSSRTDCGCPVRTSETRGLAAFLESPSIVLFDQQATGQSPGDRRVSLVPQCHIEG